MADPAFGDRPRKLRLEPWCPAGVADFIPTYPMRHTPEGNRRAIDAAQLEPRLAPVFVQPVEASLARGLISASGMRMSALVAMKKLLVWDQHH